MHRYQIKALELDPDRPFCQTCSIRLVEKARDYKGKCYYGRQCYKCRKIHGKRTLQQRFNEYVVKSSGCWGWGGNIGSGGYALIGVASSKNESAHRVSYRLHVGEIPEGMFVCHHCDNRLCTNPEHLFLGSHKDNMTDMVNKRRSTHGERNRHAKLTEIDVIRIRERAENGEKVADISTDYPIATRNIRNVINKFTWKYV